MTEEMKKVARQACEVGMTFADERLDCPTGPRLAVIELCNAVRALLDTDGWISVEERLPESSDAVLAMVDGEYGIAQNHRGKLEWTEFLSVVNDEPAKFWRPLPPPQENGTQP